MSVGWRRARGGDVVDPRREAAPAWQLYGSHGADDQDGVDVDVLDGKRVEQCADGAAASRTTAPSSQASQVSQASGRDDGRILVTVVSTSRLPVVAEMSRARRPSSPTAQVRLPTPGKQRASRQKTSEAARSHVPMANASGVAPRRARSLRSRAGAGADIARTASCACSMRSGLARAAAGPTEAAPHAWRPAGLGGHTCGWWVGIPGL
jgi:hypothetical protein